jgi:hypothetical protein
MFHSDANINLSVERSVERRRAVQAYGHQCVTEATPSFGRIGDETASGRLALRFVVALLVVMLLVGLVIVL